MVAWTRRRILRQWIEETAAVLCSCPLLPKVPSWPLDGHEGVSKVTSHHATVALSTKLTSLLKKWQRVYRAEESSLSVRMPEMPSWAMGHMCTDQRKVQKQKMPKSFKSSYLSWQAPNQMIPSSSSLSKWSWSLEECGVGAYHLIPILGGYFLNEESPHRPIIHLLSHCIRALPRRGRYGEIHPRRPRDFLRPERFPEGEARGKSRGRRGRISQ